jgi:3-hydroxybutyryl-CoA dehydrogenase
MEPLTEPNVRRGDRPKGHLPPAVPGDSPAPDGAPAEAMAPRRIAIVGAGRMGLGIAESLAMAGLEVTVTDVTPDATQAARARLSERIDAHAQAGLITEDLAQRATTVRAADSIASAVDGADLVIEAVTEDTGVKEGVLQACEAGAPSGAVIASNTSSLDIDVLAGFVKRADRFLGMHWFNPPEWTPWVEVVLGAQTDPAVADTVVTLLRRAGKRPSVVANGVGFIANRLQMALFCEAARCVEEGLATPQAIDEVVRSSFGFRLPFFGPFQIADMAGLDVYEAVVEQHEQCFGERFRVPDSLRSLTREGRLGTSSGAGYYGYDPGASDRVLVERDRRYAALSELLQRNPPMEFGD